MFNFMSKWFGFNNCFENSKEEVEKMNIGIDVNFSWCKKWKGIVIHHSAVVDSNTSNDWEGIRKYHTSWRYEDETISEEQAKKLIDRGVEGVVAPWADIAYHFGLEKENDTYIYKIGRGLSKQGAAAQGFNSTHIQICILGNYDKEILNDTQYQMIINLLIYLKENISSIDLQNELVGHWETFVKLGLVKIKEEAWNRYKTCPGKLFALGQIQEEFKNG